MAEWVNAIPAIVFACVVILLPGAAILGAAGLRGLRAWALAGPVSMAVLAVSAIVLDVVGVRFGIASVAIVVALTVALTLLVRRVSRSRWPRASLGRDVEAVPFTSVGRAIAAVGLALGGGVLAVRLMRAFGSPDAIAQLFDNVFHLNATAIIAATGRGSSLTLGNLTPASAGFYPAGFHDAAALVAAVADTSTAVSATTIVLCAVVWPLGVTFLATRLLGSRPVVFLAAGLVAPALTAFPFRMLSFGVLSSFLAALTLMPALIAVLLELFGTTRTRAVPAASSVVSLVVVGLGVAFCHPSVVVAALLLASPWAVARWGRAIADRDRVALVSVLVAAYLGGSAVLFVALRPQLNAAPWHPSQTVPQSLRSVVLLAPTTMTVSWALVALMTCAAVAVVLTIRRSWPLVASFAIAAVLYVAASALPSGALRDALVGVWYRDTERISAILMIAAVPLLITGAVALAETTTAVVSRLRADKRFAVIAGAAVLVILVPAAQLGGPREGAAWVAHAFGQTGSTPLLSADERTVLEMVGELVPADGVVVGNPMTGASLTPAFADRGALAPHVFGTRTSAEEYLLQHWDEAATDPAVCPLIRDLNAYWALDFGTHDVLGRGGDSLAGTDALSPVVPGGITRLGGAGEAALFEATICL